MSKQIQPRQGSLLNSGPNSDQDFPKNSAEACARVGWDYLKKWAKVIHYEWYGRLFCLNCGIVSTEGKLVCDHVFPVHVYEELHDDLGNLQILCSVCNAEKGAFNYTDHRPLGLRAALTCRNDFGKLNSRDQQALHEIVRRLGYLSEDQRDIAWSRVLHYRQRRWWTYQRVVAALNASIAP